MFNYSPLAFQFILGGEEGRALVEEREREDWDKFSHISTRSRAFVPLVIIEIICTHQVQATA